MTGQYGHLRRAVAAAPLTGSDSPAKTALEDAPRALDSQHALSQPLTHESFTTDPAAHVFADGLSADPGIR